MLEIALVAVAGDSAEALRHPETLHPPYLCARQLEVHGAKAARGFEFRTWLPFAEPEHHDQGSKARYPLNTEYTLNYRGLKTQRPFKVYIP